MGAESIKRIFQECDGEHHEFNFKQFWNKSVYRFACMAKQEHISDLQNKSFFESIVSAISDKRTSHPEDFEAFALSE